MIFMLLLTISIFNVVFFTIITNSSEIVGISVSNKNELAIGIDKKLSIKIIYIYDSESISKSKINFKTYGTYVFNFDGDKLKVLLSREKKKYLYNSEGNYISEQSYENSEYDDLYNKSKSNILHADGCIYYQKSQFGYNKIIKDN